MSVQKLQGFEGAAKKVRFTAGSAITDGDVVEDGDRVGVAYEDTASAAEGLIVVETDERGILMPKTTGAKTRNTKAYWDADGDPVGGVVGSGAVTDSDGTEELQFDLIDGQDETSDATYALTGAVVGDEVVKVIHISTKAAIATMAEAAGFSITDADELTSGTPVDRTSDQLLVIWRSIGAKNTFLGYFAETAGSSAAEAAVELVGGR